MTTLEQELNYLNKQIRRADIALYNAQKRANVRNDELHDIETKIEVLNRIKQIVKANHEEKQTKV